jgi:DtxR family transcriptional regulator, Mn-dependent transcriptional regulator
MKFSTSEENYIKCIYHLQAAHENVTATMLAGAVNTKAASVTDMLKKLHAKKIINYRPYKSFTLTEPGNKIALEVIRKHRLWEFFLVNKLGFKWDEVHVIAEELEHIDSKELISRLDVYLEHPCFDPHGDPIPDSKGKIRNIRQSRLDELPFKKTATVSAIKDQRTEMLGLLKHYNIGIGTSIKVLRRFEVDGSVEVKIEKLPVAVLSAQVAKNIYCTL